MTSEPPPAIGVTVARTCRRARCLRLPRHVFAANRAEIADVAGEHLWAVCAGWRVDPAKFDPSAADSGFGLLDHENILTISGPGCFKCERVYSPEIAAQPCTGSTTERMP